MSLSISGAGTGSISLLMNRSSCLHLPEDDGRWSIEVPLGSVFERIGEALYRTNLGEMIFLRTSLEGRVILIKRHFSYFEVYKQKQERQREEPEDSEIFTTSQSYFERNRFSLPSGNISEASADFRSQR